MPPRPPGAVTPPTDHRQVIVTPLEESPEDLAKAVLGQGKRINVNKEEEDEQETKKVNSNILATPTSIICK